VFNIQNDYQLINIINFIKEPVITHAITPGRWRIVFQLPDIGAIYWIVTQPGIDCFFNFDASDLLIPVSSFVIAFKKVSVSKIW
jgi:hypothetical protein